MKESAKRLGPPSVAAALTDSDSGPASVRDSLIGQTIEGRYKVEALLGEGGMGLVYRARHTALGKTLAIKVLRPDVSKDDEVLQRFKQEAQSASNIGNQHIVDVSDFGVTPNGATYFAMEFLDGVDLITAVDESKKMKADRVVHIGKQLCRALGAAHDAGIVHRDLKPENVYLIRRNGDDNFVKVLDFGIAKVADSGTRLTRAGEVFGTPHYMSPEQSGGKEVDHRTDIYALGVMFYEMLTGQVPFDADNMMGILTKHMYEDPIPPTVREPMIPDGLEAVVLKCLAKDRQHRYQSMAELKVDLDRVEVGLEIAASEFNALRATRPPSKIDRRFQIAIGVAAVLAASALVWVMASSEPEPIAAKEPINLTQIVPIAVPLGGNRANTNSSAAEGEVIRPPARSIQVLSQPIGAKVWWGNELLGITPLFIEAPITGKKVISIRKDKFRTVSVDIAPNSENVRLAELKKIKTRKPKRTPRGRSGRDGKQNNSSVLDPWAN